MLALLLPLLTSLAPLIITIGTKLIDMFVTNAAANAAAKQNFLNAIQAHVNDALQTVADMQSSDQQIADLEAETDKVK